MRRPRRDLAARRRARGLTQEALADALRVDRTTVARWEAGETEPQPWLRRGLAAALDVTTDQLASFLSADAVAVPAQSGAADSSPDTPLGGLQAQLTDLGRRYSRLPSVALLTEASQCHGALGQRLAATRFGSDRRCVSQAAAQSAILLSQLVWDASGRRDAAVALAYAREAGELAAISDDDVALVHAQLRRTYIALYSRADIRDAAAGLAAAETACVASLPVSRALSGLSGLHIAEAQAMQRDVHGCERALDQARSALAAAGPEDPAAEVASAATYDRLAGSCYLELGLPMRAEPLLASAADGLQERPKTRSLVLGNLALSRLRQRQLEAATSTLHKAIDLLEISRGGGGMTVAFAAGRELSAWWPHPAVQEVQDRLLGLVARN